MFSGASEGGAEEGEGNLSGISADEDRYGVADTRPQRSALHQRIDDAGGVRLRQHQVGGTPGGGRATRRDTDTHVGQADGGGVVGPVTGHGDHLAGSLQRLDDLHLLLG